MSKYKELDVIEIPEDVPTAGIQAGMEGAVVEVLPGGVLLVDVVDEQGYTLDMLLVSVERPHRVVGRWGRA